LNRIAEKASDRCVCTAYVLSCFIRFIPGSNQGHSFQLLPLLQMPTGGRCWREGRSTCSSSDDSGAKSRRNTFLKMN